MSDKLDLVSGRPIMMTTNTCLHVRLFHSHVDFRDLWAEEYVDPFATADAAAQLFIDQLGEHWNGAFLMALRRAVTRKLKEHDDQYGTKWATEEMGEGRDATPQESAS